MSNLMKYLDALTLAVFAALAVGSFIDKSWPLFALNLIIASWCAYDVYRNITNA